MIISNFNTLRLSELFSKKKRFVHQVGTKNTNSEIIRRCYLEILNRVPDEEGFNYYLNLLDTKKIDEKKLLTMLKNSKEYFIRKCYLEIYDREIKEGGYKYYLELIEKNEINEKKLLDIMKSTVEYKRFEFRKCFTQK